ncbi:MAG: iron-sulfur cluster assembly protein [Culturomica sp.]|jgi:FeS assembly SUF system protein|nr:iron-sulfur cluster assembly protein [Culturomica sp.]
MENEVLKNIIIEKLQTVHDPEIPVNVWDLGLIYGIEFLKPTEVLITMTLTAPGCPIADEIVQNIHDVVKEIDGIDEVTVNLVFEPAWSIDKMSEIARLELGFDV